MTFHGTLILILIGLVLVLWTLDLVRRDRLYVEYGVILSIAILGVLLVLALPSLLNRITELVGAMFPVSALTLLALCFIVFMLVYLLTQFTIVSNRLAALVQELAIQGAKNAANILSKSARDHREVKRAPAPQMLDPDEPGSNIM